jgi:hypothetical protein
VIVIVREGVKIMVVASKALTAIRILTASFHFFWSFVFFSLAVWMIWSVGNFGWLADIIGTVVAWIGISFARKGCEELMLNRPEKPLDQRGPQQ